MKAPMEPTGYRCSIAIAFSSSRQKRLNSGDPAQGGRVAMQPDARALPRRFSVRVPIAVDASLLANLTWALNAVSTGEHPLDDPKRRLERAEGAQVRMISVPVPSGKKGGIFNRVKGSPAEIAAKSKKLARQVEETIATNYGVDAGVLAGGCRE
jgi:hypothetical protein